MEHRVIELLNTKTNSNLTIEEMASILEITKEELKEVIKPLEEDGIIYLNKSGKYCLVANSSLKKGIIKVTKRKGPIVVIEGERKIELDLLSNSHKKVLHNDIVLVEPCYNGNNCQLVKVLKRNSKDYIGEVVQNENGYFLMFNTGREPIKLGKKYPVGTRLLIDGKTGIIKQEVGHKDDPNERIKELLLENGFEVGFSLEYKKELGEIADELSEEEIADAKGKGILDIRNMDIVTIDGDDTKDFDDAVCFWGDKLIVAIANTSRTIKEDSVIDKTTIKRRISVYPPGMVEPMIHHKISNGICSLNPYEDRFTVGSITSFDKEDKIVKIKTGEMIINSKKRMTYEEVNMYLEKDIILPGYEKYTSMLDNLYNIAMQKKEKMLDEGFLEFSSSEVKMAFEGEMVTNIKKRHQGKAEDLIAFLMLYHNLLMTSEFRRRGLPYIARNHDSPKDDRITNWNNLLSKRGYKVEVKKKYSSQDIKNSLTVYKNASERVILDNIAIRAQAKARYSAYNKGHFALGQKAYATFTSPIRRLSDYINQRVYVDALKYGNSYARKKWEPRMEILAKMATDGEIAADKVENAATKIRMAEYINSHYAKEDKFTGYIASIEDGYLMVLLPNYVYGKVYYSINDWTISKDGFSITNNSNGEMLLVGDLINISLKNVNIESGEIVFSRQKYIKEYEYEKEKKNDKRKVKTR